MRLRDVSSQLSHHDLTSHLNKHHTAPIQVALYALPFSKAFDAD